MDGEEVSFGDRITLSDGISIYLPPKVSARASRWAIALREARADQLPRIVQALMDNEVARIMRHVEASLLETPLAPR